MIDSQYMKQTVVILQQAYNVVLSETEEGLVMAIETGLTEAEAHQRMGIDWTHVVSGGREEAFQGGIWE